MGPAIDVQHLCRHFSTGKRKNQRIVSAVNDITFSVDAGERVAFIGPNGAGKSTTIKMLTGLLYPTSGVATVRGLVPWERRRELALQIGSLFGQRSQLWSELPARDSLNMLGVVYGLDDALIGQRVDELGELLEATDLFDQPVRTLSLGQRMRCELSAAMLHEPELLFLDEPTIGLDLLGKQLFRELLIQLNTELGTTVLLTSHDVSDIEYVADRAVVINDGSIIYDDPVRQMRRDLLATKRVEVVFTEVVQQSSLETIRRPGVLNVRADDHTLIIEIDTVTCEIADVLSGVLGLGQVHDLTVLDPALEQVIGEIYEGQANEQETGRGGQ